ncbi:MAG: hypothetical protein Q4C10_07250 [Clostridia bacterium]|nr:hypothetical protein [Clostridia bacterium]
MENIILLMLFTYPGAIAYLIYSRIAKGMTTYQEPDSFTRAALCFFISAAVTVITCGMLTNMRGGLSGLIGELKHTGMLWNYLKWSFILSIVAGVLWIVCARLMLLAVNKYRRHKHIPPHTVRRKAWVELINEYSVGECAAIIRKGGKIVRAGFPQVLPDDLSDDPVIVLSYCNRVERELAKPDWGLLGNRFLSAYNLGTDTEIEFVAAENLTEAMKTEEVVPDDPIYPLENLSSGSGA